MGTPVSLTALGTAGWAFSHWAGDLDCLDGELDMQTSLSCQAVFRQTGVFSDGFESGDTSAWSSSVP